MGGFSKVTNFLRDALILADTPNARPQEEVAEILNEELSGVEIEQQQEAGFEVVTTVSSACRLNR